MKNVAIFASGTGSNAAKIIEHFRENRYIRISLIVSNKSTAPVLQLGVENNISTLVLQRKPFYEGKQLLSILTRYGIDCIVLAGFLWLIPPYLVQAYPQKIINIHPALLPKYGGKGMYGMNVHQAVHANQEQESGMTIHFVNEQYDEGQTIFQAACSITPQDTPNTIRTKVLQLEHCYFPRIIEYLLSS